MAPEKVAVLILQKGRVANAPRRCPNSADKKDLPMILPAQIVGKRITGRIMSAEKSKFIQLPMHGLNRVVTFETHIQNSLHIVAGAVGITAPPEAAKSTNWGTQWNMWTSRRCFASWSRPSTSYTRKLMLSLQSYRWFPHGRMPMKLTAYEREPIINYNMADMSEYQPLILSATMGYQLQNEEQYYE